MDNVLTIEAAGNCEIWVISPDFAAFGRDFPTCKSQLESFCALQSSQVKLFTPREDGLRPVLRLVSKYRENGADVILCASLAGFSDRTILRRANMSDEVDYFEVSDDGFRAIPTTESSRLEEALKKVPLH